MGNPPSCMIPMSKLARHPYGLMDNAEIKGRVTATPDKGLTLTAPCRSAPEDGAPIKQNQPPSPISLTSTQSSEDVVVCWNNLMAIASNGCNSVSTTISISLTDCPTCHHGDGQSTTAVHDNDRVVPANSEASTDDSSVAPPPLLR